MKRPNYNSKMFHLYKIYRYIEASLMKIKNKIKPVKKERYRCSNCGKILNDIGWCCFDVEDGEVSPCAMELVE